MSNEDHSEDPAPMAPGATQEMEARPKSPQPERKRRWRKWILLAALALSCCCGGPIVSVPIALVRGGRQFARLHQSLSPGMSTSDLLSQVGNFRSSTLGLSRVFLYPRQGPDRVGGAGQACPTEASWVWGPGRGEPWGRGKNPSLESAATALASCDEVEFVGVLLGARLQFTVTLAEGRIATIGPASMEP